MEITYQNSLTIIYMHVFLLKLLLESHVTIVWSEKGDTLMVDQKKRFKKKVILSF